MERVPHGATVALLEIGRDCDPLAIQAKAPRTRDGRTTLGLLWEPEEKIGPQARPDRWWNAKGVESCNPSTDATRRRREDDRNKGDGRQTRPRGRALDDHDLIFPREDCMALAGTNSNCYTCHHKYQRHSDKLWHLKSLPAEEGLEDLPRPYVDPEYVPHKPARPCLNRSIEKANRLTHTAVVE